MEAAPCDECSTTAGVRRRSCGLRLYGTRKNWGEVFGFCCILLNWNAATSWTVYITAYGVGALHTNPVRRFRNGRDDMAKKRSKRTSKTSARRSKRKGKAGAAVPRRAQPKGVINAWEDDPRAAAQPSGGQVIQSPVPVLPHPPLPVQISP